MKDIHGVEIDVGMTVDSVQPSGGILSPSPKQRGLVVINRNRFCIQFKKHSEPFYRYILLDGKINEIII